MNCQQTIPSFLKEYQSFQFQITLEPEITSEREEIIKQISITPQIVKDSVNIQINSTNGVISGVYKEVFNLGQNQIKSIRRSDKKIIGYSRFDELPKDNSQDIFEFKPPRSLDYPLSFTINCIYDIKISSSSDNSNQTSVQYIRDQQFQKTFTTVVKGQWDVWSKAFREHLRNYKQ